MLLVAAAAFSAMIAFLSEDTAGAAVLLLLPILVIVRAGKPRRLAGVVAAFGVGYLGMVVYTTLHTSGVFSGAATPGVIAYAASQLAIGVAIVVVGVTLLLRGRLSVQWVCEITALRLVRRGRQR